MVHMDGQKMSKSLGNLVFVDNLRTVYDPRAIRLGIIEHHYRNEWEWDDSLMPRNQARLESWLASAVGRPGADGLVEAVRGRLDDDLDTPGALALIDAAAAGGTDVTAAAALLGVNLDRPVSVG